MTPQPGATRSGGGERREALCVVRAVLAADYACDERAFLADGVAIVPAELRAGRRRFPPRARPLALATMGAGVVVSCHPSRLAWARANLGSLGRDTLFAATTIARLARYLARDDRVLRGPDLTSICSRADLCPVVAPSGVAIELVVAPQIAQLYRYAGFRNALGYDAQSARPDMVAAVATCGGAVVGIAGASADADLLWQIGVDVAADARGRGVGRAIVGRVTEEVLRRGRIPYYTTAVSNIPSRALAASVGYRPCWVEMYARDR